jgi:hypothetical protein
MPIDKTTATRENIPIADLIKAILDFLLFHRSILPKELYGIVTLNCCGNARTFLRSAMLTSYGFAACGTIPNTV